MYGDSLVNNTPLYTPLLIILPQLSRITFTYSSPMKMASLPIGFLFAEPDSDDSAEPG